MTYPHNTNDTRPGGLVCESDLDARQREKMNQTRFERMSAAPFAIVLGICGAAMLIHWMAS